MSHGHADDIVGVGAGLVLAGVAQLVHAGPLIGEVFHTIFFGLLGGAAGFLGKRGLEYLVTKLKRKKTPK